MLDDLPGVFLSELAVFLVALNGLPDLWELIVRDVAALVGTLLPGVEVVVRAVGALADDRERAVLQAPDLEDLFQEVLRSDGNVHGEIIYMYIYIRQQKNAENSVSEEFRHAPPAKGGWP